MSDWTPTKDAEARLKSTVRKLTTSGEPELNAANIKVLKEICKEGGDSMVKQAYQNCMHYLKKPHSQVRVSTVQLIDYLFRKTHKFRTLLLDEFDTFLELTIQVTHDRETQVKLPPPKKYARILMEITAKYIYRWHADYSTGYEKLRYAYRYLREHNIVDFGQFRVNNRVDLLHQARIQEQRDRQTAKLIERKIKDLDNMYPDMEELIVQIESLLDIIIPSVEASDRIFELETDECSKEEPAQSHRLDQTCDEFQEHGMIASSSQVIQVHFSRYVAIAKEEANKDIIERLKEFRRQLVETKLDQLNTIIKTLSRKTEVCSVEMKRAIKLKHRAMNSVIKMSELEIVSMTDLVKDSKDANSKKRVSTLDHDSSEEESDQFEEVQPKEDLESYIPKHLLSDYGLEPAVDSTGPTVRILNDDSHIFGPSTSGEQSCKTKQCKALLPNGKLCPRKDKIKCPFHGTIVERDCLGVPVKEEDRIREEKLKELKRGGVPEWQDPTLLEEIRVATGIDLTMPANKKTSANGQQSKRNNKLENTKTCDLTPQQRLQKRMKKISSS